MSKTKIVGIVVGLILIFSFVLFLPTNARPKKEDAMKIASENRKAYLANLEKVNEIVQRRRQTLQNK